MEFDMAVRGERKHKEEDEFETVFNSTACKFHEDVEFARVYNMTAFEYNETEGAREFDKVFYTMMTESSEKNC